MRLKIISKMGDFEDICLKNQVVFSKIGNFEIIGLRNQVIFSKMSDFKSDDKERKEAAKRRIIFIF